jgi:hypothetical protein
MVKHVMWIALIVGCHHDQPPPVEPGGPTVVDTGDPTDRSGSMIPPEKMDEVEQNFRRKADLMSHCLSTAMGNGDVKKGTRGKIALEVVISTAGEVSSAKILRSDIEAQSVQDCVLKHVKEIAFPQLPKQYETSHTYAMEAN